MYLVHSSLLIMSPFNERGSWSSHCDCCRWCKCLVKYTVPAILVCEPCKLGKSIYYLQSVHSMGLELRFTLVSGHMPQIIKIGMECVKRVCHSLTHNAALARPNDQTTDF